MQTNHVKKAKKCRLSVWIGGMALLTALYVWAVPDTAPSPTTGWNAANPIDAAIQNLRAQIANNIQGQQTAAIDADLYRPTTLSPAQSLITQHFSGYCDSRTESGNCLVPFGDSNYFSLVKNSTYDEPGLAAANAYVATLLKPLDNSAVTSFQAYAGAINASTLAGNSALQTQYAQALSDESALSVIRQAFLEMIAIRTPPTGSEGTQPALSEMGLMEQTVLQRWMNSSWMANLATVSPEKMQQEMALMQAFQNYMSFKLYQQGERQLAVDALLALQNYRSQKNAQALLVKTSTMPDTSPSSMDVDSALDDSGQ